MMKPGKRFYKHPSLPAAAIVVLTGLLAVPTTIVLTAAGANQPPTESTDADRIFGNPTNLGMTVNSSAREFGPSISADDLSLYFTSRRPGGSGGTDLWMTTRKTKADPWGTPMNLGPTVNSSTIDGGPSISADGLSLYFSSDRPGGHGAKDLWVTTRKTTSDPWGEPVNLGPKVNSSACEHAPSISADGLSLYFSEQRGPFRPGGLGNGDIWVTTRKTKDEPWCTPVNLGPTVNGTTKEGVPSISADGLTLYLISSRYGGSGNNDLWVTTRQTTSDPWGAPANLGTTINSPRWDLSPDISSDGSTLYFASDRSGAVGGSGDFDIWQVSLKAPGEKE